MMLKKYCLIYKVLLMIMFHSFIDITKVYCTNKGQKQNRQLNFDKDSYEKDYQKSLSISKNVTKILDKLLQGYDKRLRPNYAGPPVVVGITININNINSVSEVNMDYTMDLYFRQLWVDKRLSFDGVSELVIGSDMLHKIWLPDTYLANDRKTYFHKATVQNKFIRINPDGQVLYSMRMTVTAACPMNFRYFPMDHQECDLEIESYGFRMEDIQYKWADGLNSSALDVTPNLELPQLKYKDYKLTERQFRLSTGLYSRLQMKLYFVRSLGYYITQIYIPSTLIVVLSWVSFWLDRTAAPARVSLGITTVLTMVTFIWSTNASLPKISYVKGIDVYLVCCFLMTFASVIEYAMVSYVHHRSEKRKKRNDEQVQSIMQQTQMQQQLALAFQNSIQYNNLNTSNHNLFSNSTGGLSQNKFCAENLNESEIKQNYGSLKQQQQQHQKRLIENQRNSQYYQNENDYNMDQNEDGEHFHNTPHHHHHHHQNHHHQHHQHHCNQKESPFIWERRYNSDNSLDDLDIRPVPIVVEKPKICTCNLQQYSARQFETNINPIYSSNSNRRTSPQHNLLKSTPSTYSKMQNINENGCMNSQCQRCRSVTRSVKRYSENEPMKNYTIDNLNNNEYINNMIQHQQQPQPNLPLMNSFLTRMTNGKNIPGIPLNLKKSSKKSFCSIKIKACTIDNYSRVIFPVTFFTFHLIYWTYYLRISSKF